MIPISFRSYVCRSCIQIASGPYRSYSTQTSSAAAKEEAVNAGQPIQYGGSISAHKARGGHEEGLVSRPSSGGRIRPGRQRIQRKIISVDNAEPDSRTRTRRGRESTKDGGDLVASAPSPALYSQKPKASDRLVKDMNRDADSLGDVNWYWESIPPTRDQLIHAHNFFNRARANARLLRSYAKFKSIPESDVPEVAIVGRSNVGKSSLLNAIAEAAGAPLARASQTRGFTKTMNMYGFTSKKTEIIFAKQPNGREKIVGPGGITIVDMPGYGDGSLDEWGEEIMKYFRSRKQLRRVFVLIDAEHGIKDKDRTLLAVLRLEGVSHQVVLSKIDKVYVPDYPQIERDNGKKVKFKPRGSVEDVRAIIKTMAPEIKPPVGGGALGEVLTCSTQMMMNRKAFGVDHLRFSILKAAGIL